MKSRRNKIRYSSLAMVIGVAMLSFTKVFVSADSAAVLAAGQNNLPAIFAVAGGLTVVISASILFSAIAAKR